MSVTPQGNRARLFRAQPPEFFINGKLLAVLDEELNVVHYRRDVFPTLSLEERKRIYFLREKCLPMPATTGF